MNNAPRGCLGRACASTHDRGHIGNLSQVSRAAAAAGARRAFARRAIAHAITTRAAFKEEANGRHR
jgi:hypothetical protein